ncbi:eIF-2-alpha kinase GCN2 [Dissostichus eleginoides]|uniref:EIF-2-alpha kinase GCN2 n=1 Tax=Dissostichus eleginoides TaxID=100907 RepID=A0AAD9CRY4_DISEL|nr:eIF-2-alpha kinase GCN2 [Dissostichus eleginoides]
MRAAHLEILPSAPMTPNPCLSSSNQDIPASDSGSSEDEEILGWISKGRPLKTLIRLHRMSHSPSPADHPAPKVALLFLSGVGLGPGGTLPAFSVGTARL